MEKKQKANLVQAAAFSSTSITARPHKQPCCVATMSALNQKIRLFKAAAPALVAVRVEEHKE